MFDKSALVLLAVSLALVSCQTDQWGADQTVSTHPVASATLPPAPNVVSNKAYNKDKSVPTGPGVLLSGWAGSEINAAMNDTDRVRNRVAENRACNAPVGQQVTWNNPKNGNSGTILPVRDGYDNNGAYCRDFQQTVTLGGRQQQGGDKACQQPDGSWKVVR